MLVTLALGCDRKIEPFDPDEQPSEPDLSRIFPEGAERAEQQPPGLPPAPGEGPRGAPAMPQQVAAAAEPAEAGAAVRGRVEVAPELAGRVPAGAVLFIIARRGAGGGPPLAVKRVANPSFPLDFQLGPEDRMIQQMPWAGPMTLSARVDSDGNASSRTPGDLQGSASAEVDPGASGVVILLDSAL